MVFVNGVFTLWEFYWLFHNTYFDYLPRPIGKYHPHKIDARVNIAHGYSKRIANQLLSVEVQNSNAPHIDQAQVPDLVLAVFEELHVYPCPGGVGVHVYKNTVAKCWNISG
jgi:hypothetical protein